MTEKRFALKGICIYSKDRETLEIKDGYVLCENGVSQGVFEALPEADSDIKCYDFSGKLIIPGLIDLHVHAPQYPIRGYGMDLELLAWLEKYIFPEEAKFSDLEYAEKVYGAFAEALLKSFTTRACVYGTIHTAAGLKLMDLLEETGLKTMVGKVNMNRNCPEALSEGEASEALEDTEKWLKASEGKYRNTQPILTPRFIPSCTDALLYGLGRLKVRYGVPYQSHLSENPSEIEWVKRLCPDSENYADAYARRGAFGPESKTVMAHCVYLNDEEIELLSEKEVFVAHCPESNINLASGIAPIRKYLSKGIHVGLGSDVAAGSTLNLFVAMRSAVQASKLYWRLLHSDEVPISMEEAFYLATKGGGAFFGRVGSFEKGYRFDAVVIDDSRLAADGTASQEMTVKERLERMMYLGDASCLASKFVDGILVR